MKLYFIVFGFLLSISSAQAEVVGFSSAYNIANWTSLIDGGTINTSLAPASISLTSSDDQSLEPNKYQEFTIAAVAPGQISFNWAYESADTEAFGDDFGWVLNGVFTKLSDSDGLLSQNGVFSANISAGDVFGFRAYSFDSTGGAAITTISQFAAPVPLPAAVWLFGTGLFGFLWQAKRKNLAVM
ncbi:MAG: PEP-CTERM sorting domain-containing protein [Methylococcales bacterium]